MNQQEQSDHPNICNQQKELQAELEPVEMINNELYHK